MILDDKGRLFGKVSIIDIFVLITVVAIVFVAVFQFGRRTSAATIETVQIEFRMDALEDFTVRAVSVGDIISDDANGNFLGDIINIEVGESIVYDFGDSGELVRSSMDNYSSIVMTTEVVASYLDGSVIIGGNMYTTGTLIIIRAGNARIQLNISNITRV